MCNITVKIPIVDLYEFVIIANAYVSHCLIDNNGAE